MAQNQARINFADGPNPIPQYGDVGQTNPYLKGGLDTNEILRAKLDPDFFEGYCIGTIHKRLHEATSRFRNDPSGRRAKYVAVLYYAQQLASLVAPTDQSGTQDLNERFSRLGSDGRQQGAGRVSAPPA